MMQECFDEEIAPKDRHSAERSAQLWASDARFLRLGLEFCASLNFIQGMRQARCRKHSEICPKHHGERRAWTL